MEQNSVASLSFARILESVPDLKHLGTDLIMTRPETDYSGQGTALFKYPMRLDGIIINLHTSGRVNGCINLKEYEVRESQIVVCAPGDIVQMYEDIRSPRLLLISSAYLHGMQIRLQDLLSAFFVQHETPVFTLSQDEVQELCFYYDLLLRDIERPGTFQKEIVNRLTALYIYKVGNAIYNHRAERLPANKIPVKRDDLLFRRFIELLGEHHRTERRVDFYARQLCVTAKYFSAVVRRVSGRTASDWIDSYVILEAKSLLKYSEMSIQEIAFYLNFANPSFFGKFFKHHTGMSPGEYKVQ